MFYSSTTDEFFRGQSAWLRLSRMGDRVLAYVSHDGQTWIKTGVVATEFPAKVQVVLEPRDTAEFQTPSGGGMYPAKERDPENIAADVISGHLTPETAERIYGYIAPTNPESR